MTDRRDPGRRSSVRSASATLAAVASEAVPFPRTTDATPIETFLPDWRRRLVRNLARRNDSRWDPLTMVHTE